MEHVPLREEPVSGNSYSGEGEFKETSARDGGGNLEPSSTSV